MACIMSKGFRKEGGQACRKGGKTRERRMRLLLSTTCLRLMLPPSLSLCESRSSQRAVSGSRQHRVENIESMLPPAFESRVIVWCCDIRREHKKKKNMYEETVIPFHPSPSFSFHLCFLIVCLSLPFSFHCLLLSLSHLACLKIYNSSPDVKGEKFRHMCYLFIYEAGRGILGEIRCLNDSGVCSVGNAERRHLQYTH